MQDEYGDWDSGALASKKPRISAIATLLPEGEGNVLSEKPRGAIVGSHVCVGEKVALTLRAHVRTRLKASHYIDVDSNDDISEVNDYCIC